VECRRRRAGEGFEECWGDDVAYRKTVGEALVEADKAGDVLSIICGAWSSCLSSVRRFVDVSRGVFGCQSSKCVVDRAEGRLERREENKGDLKI
jgi:hypothetical protein